MSKPPPHQRQLRRHEFVIHYGHIFDTLSGKHALLSIEEKNAHFLNWWWKWTECEFPPTIRYLAASLEITPDVDPRTGKPNTNAGLYHINACVFWNKVVRFSQEYHTALYLPSFESGKMPASVRVIGSPAGVIDYCTASGKFAGKQYLHLFEHSPTGNRPFQGARRKDALMDMAINFIQEGYDLQRMWVENPRVVMHFGVLKLRDLIAIQRSISSYSEGSGTNSSRGDDEPPVTGFSNVS